MSCAVAIATVLHSPALSLCCFLPFVSPCTLYFVLKVSHISPVWGSRCSCTDCYQSSPCLSRCRFIATYAGAWRPPPPTRPHVSLISLQSPNFVESRQTCTQWMSPRRLYAKNACVNPHAGDRDILTTGLMTSCCQLVALNTAHRQMTRYFMWRSRWQWNRLRVRVSIVTVVAIVAVVTTLTMLCSTGNQGNQEVNGKISNHGTRSKNVNMVTIT
jgi:hypothetical protein